MKNARRPRLIWRLSPSALIVVALFQAASVASASRETTQITVDCDAGGDLGATLQRLHRRGLGAGLSPHRPVVINVLGRCEGPVEILKHDVTLRGEGVGRSSINRPSDSSVDVPVVRAEGMRRLVFEHLSITGGGTVLELIDTSADIRDSELSGGILRGLVAVDSEVTVDRSVVTDFSVQDDSRLVVRESEIFRGEIHTSRANIQGSSLNSIFIHNSDSRIQFQGCDIAQLYGWDSTIRVNDGEVGLAMLQTTHAFLNTTVGGVAALYDSTVHAALVNGPVVALWFSNASVARGTIDLLTAIEFSNIALGSEVTVDNVTCSSGSDICHGQSCGACATAVAQSSGLSKTDLPDELAAIVEAARSAIEEPMGR